MKSFIVDLQNADEPLIGSPKRKRIITRNYDASGTVFCLSMSISQSLAEAVPQLEGEDEQ